MQQENWKIDFRAVEPFYKNGYMVSPVQGEGVVYMDPGDEAGSIIELIQQRGTGLDAILVTHAHIDHISGISEVRVAFPEVPIYTHRDGLDLYHSLEDQGRYFGMPYGKAPEPTHFWDDDDVVRVRDLEFEVLLTPGHSPGHVSLMLGDHLFCGDAVFAGSIGRTDLPGASLPQLMESIRSRILTLPDHVVLHPGHGPATTVGEERRTNPFLLSLR